MSLDFYAFVSGPAGYLVVRAFRENQDEASTRQAVGVQDVVRGNRCGRFDVEMAAVGFIGDEAGSAASAKRQTLQGELQCSSRVLSIDTEYANIVLLLLPYFDFYNRTIATNVFIKVPIRCILLR